MKKITTYFRLILLSLIGVLTGMVTISAQNVIKIHINDLEDNWNDENIPVLSLSLVAEGEVVLTGVKEAYSPDLSTYTLTDRDVTISGNVSELDCSYTNISSLDCSGCLSLKRLECYSSYMTKLNVAGLTGLTYLNCKYNAIRNLDLTGCSGLEYLDAHFSDTKTLILAGCIGLKEVNVSQNEIASLDFTDCTLLETLDCHSNRLAELKLTGCANLVTVDCYENELTSLNLSGREKLASICVDENNLESLMAKDCSALTYVSATSCKIQSADFSNSLKLSDILIEKNQLKSINISGCSSLKFFNFYLNQLPLSAMTQLIEALPTRDKDSAGKITVLGIDTASGYKEGNKCSKDLVAAMTEKNWTVQFRDADNYDTRPFEGYVYYAVTVAPIENGSLEIEGRIDEDLLAVEEGAKLKVKATPEEGYFLSGLKANGVDIKEDMQFVVDKDVTLEAEFDVYTSKVTLTCLKGGTISIEGYTEEQLLAVKRGELLKVIVKPESENYMLKSLTMVEKVVDEGEKDFVTDITENKQFVVGERDIEIIAAFEQTVSIGHAGDGKLSIYTDDEMNIYIEGAEVDEVLKLYSVSGKQIDLAVADCAGKAVLGVQEAGIYIVVKTKTGLVQKVVVY